MITSRAAKVAAALAAGSLVLALAACGSGEKTQEGSADGVTQIDWWAWNPSEDTVAPYLEAFEADHPEIKVNYRFVASSDYYNALRLAITSDSGPDVFGLQVGATTNQFAAMSEDLTSWAAKGIGTDWKDTLYSTDQLAVDGKQVAMPWMITANGLIWYNQGILTEAGAKVPTTLAEWTDTCAKVEKIGKTCFVQGAKDAWANIDVYQAIANQISPGLFYKAVAGEVPFTSPEFVQAFETWKTLFDSGIMPEGALGSVQYPDAVDAFNKGEAAMLALGSWNNDSTTSTRMDALATQWGDPALAEQVLVPAPFPVVVPDGTAGSMAGGPDVGWAMASNSDRKEAAWTFIQWLVGSDSCQKIIAKTIQQPALKSVAIDTSDVRTPEQVTALEAELPGIENMVGPRQIPNADVETALGQALSSVAAGSSSPADAAAAVQTAVTAATGG